ncbi:hypothetical protein BDZ85DRAFT_322754 [Elsinoe ampelina]|uniref:Uncharacterized protein n=1 Tax=Elsinoe ampelina TaxID=302913 RepID=A0A6A6FZM6_9PEZI|nr:hypothetical protein BDZ85DRAFT_322754 [Elsinoe ampelina]
MPPKAAAANGATGAITLSEHDLKLIGMVFQCMVEEPKIDIKKLAGMAGYTNPGSASNAWRTLKTKLGIVPVPKTDDNGVPTTPASKGRKRTKKDAGGEGEQDTPAKKPRGRKAKEVAKEEIEEEVKAEIKDESDDDEDAPGSPDDMDTAAGAKVKDET